MKNLFKCNKKTTKAFEVIYANHARPAILSNEQDTDWIGLLNLSSRIDNWDIFKVHQNEFPGQNITDVYRYESITSKAGKLRPVVKIDTKRGLLYFLKEEESRKTPDSLEFERRGYKLSFFTIGRKDRL